MRRKQSVLCGVVALLVGATLCVGIAVYRRGLRPGNERPGRQGAGPEQPGNGGAVPRDDEDICYPKASREGVLALRLVPVQEPTPEGDEGPWMELTNPSGEAVTIRYGPYPWGPAQYLTLKVWDDNGRFLFDYTYSDLMSIKGNTGSVVLKPGQTYSARLQPSLIVLADSPSRPLKPGTYRVQGVFRYKEWLARSQVIRVTVRPRTN
jgi:hypothetical protein